MKKIFLIATAIAAIGGATTHRAHACPLRPPTFELTGFPISRHQVAVLGSAQVEESSARPMLMLAGMPASPHQIAVLTPRPKSQKIAVASADPIRSTVGLTRPSLQRSTGQALCASD
jgi:hypothetical protein